MAWQQNYDPLGSPALSTVVSALPVAVLLGAIAIARMRIHRAALLGLAVAVCVAFFVFGAPLKLTAAMTIYGAANGLFPIGWIILNLIFLHQLTVEKGSFTVLRSSLARLTPDARIQVILVAFALGAFFEGAAGFGTPVAVTGAMLIELGFAPLQASGLSLIANTAPVAFGALGTPIIALAKATGIGETTLSAMVGRQLPFFSALVPFWVVCAMVGWRGMLGIWPAALTAGVAFAVPQYWMSNHHGPWLVDIVAAISSLAASLLLLCFWRPAAIWGVSGPEKATMPGRTRGDAGGFRVSDYARAWMPWLLLALFVFLWGLPEVRKKLDSISAPKFNMPGLHNLVLRAPPVVSVPTLENPTPPETAPYYLNWLSATGTGILAAAILGGLAMGFGPRALARVYLKTLVRVRFSLLTIAAMLALGYVTRYSGADATLGLALAHTGILYPFFGTMLGWLGVALTGSDTASNVLFGGLQVITAHQTGVPGTLMAAANSSGGVMGKMIDAQSIVVASTATNWYGQEGRILRYVFFHSVALAVLVSLLVMLQAYVAPFSGMVVK